MLLGPVNVPLHNQLHFMSIMDVSFVMLLSISLMLSTADLLNYDENYSLLPLLAVNQSECCSTSCREIPTSVATVNAVQQHAGKV